MEHCLCGFPEQSPFKIAFPLSARVEHEVLVASLQFLQLTRNISHTSAMCFIGGLCFIAQVDALWKNEGGEFATRHFLHARIHGSAKGYANQTIRCDL